MKFQLVVQFPETFFATHEDLVAFEDRTRERLPRTAEVDGHDIGSGTVNFFYTDHPLATHTVFRKRVATNAFDRHMRVAYRSVRGAVFTNLWPFRDDRPFDYTYSAAENPFTAASKRKIPKRSAPGMSKLETKPKRSRAERQ